MSPTLPPTLSSPPASLVKGGRAPHGQYAGILDRFDWSCLDGLAQKGRLWQRTHHKRWLYVGMGNEAFFLGVAIVSLGWCQTAFAYVFDRQRKQVVVDWSADGLPGLNGAVGEHPIHGARAWFKSFGTSLSITHGVLDCGKSALQVRVKAGGIDLDADLVLDHAPPFLLAIGPIAQGGLWHATQKSPGLPVEGSLVVRGRGYPLADAVACVDSSNGLLARDTAWRWACAQGRNVGFNLQAGYFGDCENALWLDGQLVPLGRAEFEFDAGQPLKPWHVRTQDGLLDLMFQPEGARQSDRNLLIAASHYVQPVGTFHGEVRASMSSPPRRIDGLLGVTEDHRSRW